MARYVPGQVPITPDVAQVERWLREETDQIRNSTDDIYTLMDFVLEIFVAAGYGAIEQRAVTAFPIDGTWTTFDLWDGNTIPDERGVSANLPTGFTLETSGFWRINTFITLTFAEVNAGRTVQMRVFNSTTATPGEPFDFFVGRNAEGVNLAVNALVAADVSAGNQDFEVQIRTDDVFTAVQAIGSIWDLNHISEYKGDFGLESLRRA